MAAMIALVAVCLFAAGVAAGIIGVVAVAIHREEHNHTLASAAPGQVTSAARWLNGLYLRAPAAPPPATGNKAPGWPAQQACLGHAEPVSWPVLPFGRRRGSMDSISTKRPVSRPRTL